MLEKCNRFRFNRIYLLSLVSKCKKYMYISLVVNFYIDYDLYRF